MPLICPNGRQISKSQLQEVVGGYVKRKRSLNGGFKSFSHLARKQPNSLRIDDVSSATWKTKIKLLNDQLDAAVAEAERIAQLESDQVANTEATRQQVEELRDAVRRAQADLDVAREDLLNREQSYAIVPYKGAHGTDRRPIFIGMPRRTGHTAARRESELTSKILRNL